MTPIENDKPSLYVLQNLSTINRYSHTDTPLNILSTDILIPSQIMSPVLIAY